MEPDVKSADEVVALLSGCLGRGPVTPVSIGHGGLAKMASPIAHHLASQDIAAEGFGEIRDRAAESVVAQMADMERLIEVGVREGNENTVPASRVEGGVTLVTGDDPVDDSLDDEGRGGRDVQVGRHRDGRCDLGQQDGRRGHGVGGAVTASDASEVDSYVTRSARPPDCMQRSWVDLVIEGRSYDRCETPLDRAHFGHGSLLSIEADSALGVGASMSSGTASSRSKRSCRRLINWTAVSESPPTAKKSASTPISGNPSVSAYSDLTSSAKSPELSPARRRGSSSPDDAAAGGWETASVHSPGGITPTCGSICSHRRRVMAANWAPSGAPSADPPGQPTLTIVGPPSRELEVASASRKASPAAWSAPPARPSRAARLETRARNRTDGVSKERSRSTTP